MVMGLSRMQGEQDRPRSELEMLVDYRTLDSHHLDTQSYGWGGDVVPCDSMLVMSWRGRRPSD